MYGAFFFTVALLVTTAYFLMGGLPLLVLKHDVPIDARFIRSFFNVYYRAAFWTSLGASVSFALWGRYAFALGALLITATTAVIRRYLIAAMARLAERIEASEASAIRHFRRVHSVALAVNFLQLVVVVWGVLQLSRQLSQ
jgi:hypothetical protein